MNILFVHEISYLRPPIWELHALTELLSVRGHNVYVIDYGTSDIGLVARYRETDIVRTHPGAKVHLIRSPFLNIPVVNRLSYSLTYYTIIRKVLLEKKIDAVLLYSAPTNGWQTILVAKQLGIPVVFRSIDALHKLAPKILSLPTKIAESWVYRRVDKILTITPALSRYVVGLGANPAKVGILPLGITLDLPLDAPELKIRGMWDETQGKCSTLVFAGTLPLFSGLPEFLEQMPEMVARIPGLRLLIVGDGKQRPKLEKMVQELGLQERVKITGMIPHEDVPKWVAAADVGVLTFPAEGATRDIFPTKVLQYMACGKPVVATPLPGLVGFGLGQEHGVVYVRNGDWVSAIRYALADKEWLGRKARDYVEQEHGYDRIVSRLEGELEVLCKSR